MTLAALFQLSGRIGLFLTGLAGIWATIWFTFILNQLPQYESLPWKTLQWSRRKRLQVALLSGSFSVGLLVFAVKVPSEQFTSTDGGLIFGCSSPFLVACVVAMVRTNISELRLAFRLRRQQLAERTASTDHSNPNWADH
jgi:hypothetical protein